MKTSRSIGALKRFCLTLAAGGLLLETTSCTLEDVFSAVGITSLLNTLLTLST